MNELIILGCSMVIIGLVCIITHKLKHRKREHIMFVIGSGGHTTQMLYMMRDFQFEKVSQVVFAYANSDKTSLSKVNDYFKRQNIVIDNLHNFFISRSREVKQSYFTTIFTTLIAFIKTFLTVLIKYRSVDMIIMNGPGTCVPIGYTYFLLNKVRLTDTKIVFIQSWCRVNQLSLTGKLLKPIAHRFIIHWKELESRNKSAEYYGNLL